MSNGEDFHKKFMMRAIELSEQGGIVEKTGGCFGAIVVTDKGEIVGEGFNHVLADNDPTAHGEVVAIRKACKKLGRPHIPECIVYTSAEPCPMCYATCMWAHVKEVYYAATYQDVKDYGDFDDDHFDEQLKLPYGEREIKLFPLMRDEAIVVWKKYQDMPDKVHY